MAAHVLNPGDVSCQVTLTASSVETVQFQGISGTIEVIGDGTAAVYYTLDGSVPTVAGANTFVLPAGVVTVASYRSTGRPQIQMISSGTPTVNVQAIPS